MSVLQKISAAKSRRSSLQSNQSQHPEEEEVDEEESEQQLQQLLKEARQFGRQHLDGTKGRMEDAKLLRTLCDLLEGSLMMYYSSSKSVEKPAGEENNKNNTEECNKSHRNFYETWAAGFQRPLRKKATPVLQQKSAVGNVAEMGTIQEEHEHEHQQQHNKDLEAQIEGIIDKEDMIAYQEIDEAEPLLINLLPHVALVAVVLSWLLIGSAIFRWIDPEIGAKSHPRSFIWCFQLLTTIGWGDSRATNALSQAFTILYILLGIPMLFSAYANMGRALTELCCILWPKLEAWVRDKIIGAKKNHSDVQESAGGKAAKGVPEVQQRMPVAAICVLFLLHNLVGLLIYSVWLKQWPVVTSIYYSITTMATSGFGDYHPDTDSWMEVIVAMLYLSVGITLLSALFLTISLYYQLIHHVYLKDWLATSYYRTFSDQVFVSKAAEGNGTKAEIKSEM